MVLSELAHKDSNLEMTESESVALPFGDGPLTCLAGVSVSRFPYCLSTSVIIGQESQECNPFFAKTAFEFLAIFKLKSDNCKIKTK